jgi:hypothetical protein
MVGVQPRQRTFSTPGRRFWKASYCVEYQYLQRTERNTAYQRSKIVDGDAVGNDVAAVEFTSKEVVIPEKWSA